MKTMKMNKVSAIWLMISLSLACTNVNTNATTDRTERSKKIKIALLLDTSNSMDGLIEQAKSQLWTMVNELAKARCEGESPSVQIALYEYGNDNLPASEGYTRLVTPLTNDLDKISSDLFRLKTNGGSEFCGFVIHTALEQLDWEASDEDLKIIFIAGNEPFTQGNIDYRKSCLRARDNGVIVNTIHCGTFEEGISGQWKDGALLAKGDYMSIDHNKKTQYIETPYDDKITELNMKLNETYIGYGAYGKEKKAAQIEQDQNAMSYSKANLAKRAASKSSHIYKNSQWDLVDAAEEGVNVSEIAQESLPAEMAEMSDTEKESYIAKKKEERTKIQQQINELSLNREAYITEKKKESDSDNLLDNVMVNAIKKQAETKNFIFE